MQQNLAYEVIQNDVGWQVVRRDRTPLVEFPTRMQAVRAALAVSADEGAGRVRIRNLDGTVEWIRSGQFP